MAMIFFLKMLCDASLYYMFASPIAGYFGGGPLMACMILQCVIYALSRIVKNPFLRFVTLIPLGLCFILRLPSLADTIALIPITLFIFWQSLAGKPQPDISRQRQWLEECLKVLILAVAVGLVTKNLTVVIPWAAFWLLSNIALLRALRHETAVRNDPRFHLMNLGLVASIPAISICLSSERVISLVVTPLSTFYRQVLLPVLVSLLWIPFMLLQWLFNLLFPPYANNPTEEVPEDLGEFKEPFDTEIFDIPNELEILFWVVLALGVAAILFLLLRSFFKTQASTSVAFRKSESAAHSDDLKPKKRLAESSNVQRIRRQYRKFLKLCRGQGIVITESFTSRDIDQRAQRNSNLSPFSPKIRQLYIKARYAGSADHTAVKEMTQLCAEAKKSTKP